MVVILNTYLAISTEAQQLKYEGNFAFIGWYMLSQQFYGKINRIIYKKQRQMILN